MSDDTLISIVMFSLIFGGPLIWFVVHTLATTWERTRCNEQNAQLKRDMIERGYTADEIVRVLGAESNTPAAPPAATATAKSPPLDANAQFVLEMVDRGCSIDDVTRVLEAGAATPARSTPSQNAQITLELIDRGHSADEVARILEAGLHPPASAHAPA